MDYMFNLEKSSGSPSRERKLSQPHTPQSMVQQFDVTYEKEIYSLLENKNNKTTKIIAVLYIKLDLRSTKQWKVKSNRISSFTS